MSLTQPRDSSAHALPALVDLHNRLDALWTAYLHNLDQYAVAQKTMEKHMSAGFLSLARANFNARNGVRRYGKDYFHERAVASKRVEISGQDMEDSDGLTKLTVVEWKADDASGDTRLDQTSPEDEVGAATKTKSSQTQQPSPPTTPPEPEADTSHAADDVNQLEQPQTPNSDPPHEPKTDPASTSSRSSRSLDPLRWFGILVPPDLRTAQASFASAVETPVADAINAARRMRLIEIEIRKLRKEIRKAEKVTSS